MPTRRAVLFGLFATFALASVPGARAQEALDPGEGKRTRRKRRRARRRRARRRRPRPARPPVVESR